MCPSSLLVLWSGSCQFTQNYPTGLIHLPDRSASHESSSTNSVSTGSGHDATATSGGTKQLRHPLSRHFLYRASESLWPAARSPARSPARPVGSCNRLCRSSSCFNRKTSCSYSAIILAKRWKMSSVSAESRWSTNSRNTSSFDMSDPTETQTDRPGHWGTETKTRSCWRLNVGRPEIVKFQYTPRWRKTGSLHNKSMTEAGRSTIIVSIVNVSCLTFRSAAAF